MKYDIDQRQIDTYLHKSARLRSEAFTGMCARFGQRVRRLAASITAMMA